MPSPRPPLPFFDLAELDAERLQAELLPALAVGVMSIPQGIAYALIAGLPPAMGLYAATIPTLVGALARSSRLVVIGPTNAVSLVVATSMGLAAAGEPVTAAATLAAMVGLLQIAAGVFRLSALVDYISAAVVAGYITGAATLITVGQLPNLTGTTASGGDIVSRLGSWLLGLVELDPLALGLGASAIGLIYALRTRLPRGFPMLGVLGLATLLSWLLGLDRFGITLVRDLASIPGGLPPAALPSPSGTIVLLPVAAAAALLSVVEATSISRSMASQTGERPDMTTDFVGLGLANLASSIFGGYPVSGSLSRSALLYQLGGRTRLAPALAGLIVLGLCLTVGPLLDWAPIPALAGIVMVIAHDLIDVSKIRSLLQAGSTDRFAFLGTVLGTWILPLDQAIFVGVAISIVLFLRRARLLRVREMRFDRVEPVLHEVALDAQPDELGPEQCTAARILHVEGPLFFGAASELEQALFNQIDNPSVKVLVVRLKRAHGIDYTTSSVLQHAHGVMEAQGRTLMLVGLQPDALRHLERTGVAETFHRQELYPAEPGWFGAMNHGLERAHELLQTRHAEQHRCLRCPLTRYVQAVAEQVPAPVVDSPPTPTP
jgi:SulP family sulfate permease